MEVPYAPRVVSGAWVLGGWAGTAYGVFLTVLALRSPPGVELTGHWVLQVPFKASMALLLTVAAAAHPIVRERQWLMPALLLSALGDALLAVPWWTLSFVLGLVVFLLAHVCFLVAMVPLIPRWRPSNPRMAVVILIWLSAGGLLAWFWPYLSRDGMTIPVTAYILVLTVMASAAQLARLPTIWTAVGALCFTVSDTMIGVGRFVLQNNALGVPTWWLYAAAQVLITAGFFFGREDPDFAEVGEDSEAGFYDDRTYDDGLDALEWPAEGFE